MIALAGDRTVLQSVFAGRVDPRTDGITASSFAEIPPSEVVVLYANDAQHGDIPESIVVESDNLREFFAWAASYLGQWSPLTSSVRVFRRADVSEMGRTTADQARLSAPVTRGLASLILGEVLCEWKLAGETSNPSLLSLRSTFAYASAQGISHRRLDVASLHGLWERAQRLLNAKPRRIPGRTFMDVLQPIANAILGFGPANSGELGEFITEIVATRRLPLERLPATDDLLSRTDSNHTSMRREDAVVDLEKWLARKGCERPIEKIVTACLATRLSQGALSHFDVLSKMTRTDAETQLWYSFISGFLSSEPSVQAVERLLFRLSRELSVPTTLQADVGLQELEVLVQPNGLTAPWVGIGAGYVTVELENAVCACFRTPERPSLSNAGMQSADEPRRDEQSFDDLLRQLRILYERKGEANQKRRRRKQG